MTNSRVASRSPRLVPREHNTSARVELVEIADLKQNSRPLRKHSNRQIRQIADSIDTFGFNVPIIIDGEGNIISGAGRTSAALLLGLSQVPAIRLDHLNRAQLQAFAIADNKLAEHATWDNQLLGEVLYELSLEDLEFSLDITGFSIPEIDILIEGAAAPAKKDAVDNPVDLPGRPPISKVGDLWLLDQHRLINGDAQHPETYQVLMGGASASMAFTDPPYNVPINGHVSGTGRHPEFAMAAGEMSAVEFTAFLRGTFEQMAKVSALGALHFICMDWRHSSEVLLAAMPPYTEFKNLCVWVKDNGGMGSLYRSQHELVFVFKSGKASHRNNVQLGKFGRNRTNVWTYPGISGFGNRHDEPDLAKLHPTVKPVALVADAILDCTARGDIVLDPFLGSGSTLLACQRVGRVCHAIELAPRYVDTAILRWQRFTGGCATHAESGKTFDELASEWESSHDQ